MKKRLFVIALIATGSGLFADSKTTGDPEPAEPLTVVMGQRKPVRVRVARNQATLIRLPEGQRVMNVYGGDKGDGGVWGVDAGKVPTRYIAVKPKEKGIHTTLHVVSNTGQEISFFLQEVTGIDGQFDAEVEAQASEPNEAPDAAPPVKWVPAEEAQTCAQHASALSADFAAAAQKAQADIAEARKQAQAKSEADKQAFQMNYPKTLNFAYQWSDEKKARRLGFVAAWSDDKFTYFKGSKVMALYEINEDGKPSLIQYSYSDGIYTVPKILYDGYFAIGMERQDKLSFHRDRSKP
jgi:type IV secretion system protein VirB9